MRRMRSHTYLLAVLLVVTSTVVLVSSPASGGPLGSLIGNVVQPVLQGPGVIVYGLAPYDFEDSHRDLYSGKQLPGGGCEFPGRIQELQTGESLTEIEVAYDPNRCLSLVESGTLEREPEFLRTPDPEVNGLFAAPTALTRHQAYKWAWYDEPARWLLGCDVEEQFSDVCVLPPVNTVRTDIEWTPDGTCSVAPGTTAEADHTITMYEGTRWTVVTDKPETNPASSPGVVPCGEEVISRSVNRFRNAFFCRTISLGINPTPTETFYNPVEVRGDKDGTAHVPVPPHSKSGGCSSFLRFGHKGSNVTIPQ